MATTKTKVLPLQIYPAGTHLIPASNLNNNVAAYLLEIARCTTATPTIWPDPASTIEINIEVSFDNGVTWVGGGGFSAYGGIYVRRDGTEGTTSSARFDIPSGTRRKIRASITLSHDIYTTADLSVMT